MYIRRIKQNAKTYYYLARRRPDQKEREEILSIIGSLESPNPSSEDTLFRRWCLSLQSGTDTALQKMWRTEKKIAEANARELGKGFDLEKCIEEMKAVHKKYGGITKTILEKQARPNGDLSWGVSTILNNLRRRNFTLLEVFKLIKEPSTSEMQISKLRS